MQRIKTKSNILLPDGTEPPPAWVKADRMHRVKAEKIDRAEQQRNNRRLARAERRRKAA